MYEQGKAKKIGKSDEAETLKASSASFNWKLYSQEELIKFMDEIKACLPALTLRDIDMEQELLMQYHALRSLQNDVLMDEDTPVNQRAQVANSVSAVLAKIGDLQQSLYDSERLKRIEKLLIATLGELPIKAAEAFLSKYEEELEKV